MHFSVETEMIVLSGIMQHSGVLDDIQFLKPAHFYSPLHALIYQGMRDFEEAGGTVFDLFSLSAAFLKIDKSDKKNLSYAKKFSMLDDRGMDWYLAEINNTVSVKANLVRYATIVQDHAIRRELENVGNRISDDISRATPVAELVDAATQRLAAVSAGQQKRTIEYSETLTNSHIAAIEARLQGKEAVLTSGLRDLDEALNGGFCGGDLIVIGARPGMGKTALATGFGLSAAAQKDEDGELRNGVLHFSMEMQNIRNTDRIISYLGKVDSRKLKNGLLQEQDYDAMTFAYSEFVKYPYGMYDKPACKLHEIANLAKKAQTDFALKGQKLSMIVIDYVQLMSPSNPKLPRHEAVSEISKGLKTLAKDFNLPVIALSQFNREADKEKRPSIAHLKDSGSIEQDADIILFPYREEQDDPDTNMRGYADLYVAKNRNGALAHIGLRYEGEYTKFSNWEGVMPSIDKPNSKKK